MLKIEWAINTPSAYIIERKGDVVLIDYKHWMTLDKATRTRLLEREHEMWEAEQPRSAINTVAGMYQPKLTANERNLADALERMEDKVWTPEFSDDGVHWEPAQAVNLDDEVDYKQAFEEAEAQLTAYRNIVTRIQEAWRVSFSWESFGDTAKPLMAELLELLHREQNGVAPDTARMSVPDSDEEIDWQAQGKADPKAPEVPVVDFRGIPEPVEDHVIRAWDEKTQQVVYWHHDRGWRPDLKGAKRFTRVRALEIANSGNSVWPSHHVVNICAIQA